MLLPGPFELAHVPPTGVLLRVKQLDLYEFDTVPFFFFGWGPLPYLGFHPGLGVHPLPDNRCISYWCPCPDASIDVTMAARSGSPAPLPQCHGSCERNAPAQPKRSWTWRRKAERSRRRDYLRGWQWTMMTCGSMNIHGGWWAIWCLSNG